MSRHTPGPWRHYAAKKHYPAGSQYDYGRIVWAKGRGEVAQTPGLTDDQEDEANARLIAAAPELLEALKLFVWPYQKGSRLSEDQRIEVARAAIAKAEGRA